MYGEQKCAGNKESKWKIKVVTIKPKSHCLADQHDKQVYTDDFV